MTHAEEKRLRDRLAGSVPIPMHTVPAHGAGGRRGIVSASGYYFAESDDAQSADALVAAVNALPGLLDQIARLREVAIIAGQLLEDTGLCEYIYEDEVYHCGGDCAYCDLNRVVSALRHGDLEVSDE